MKMKKYLYGLVAIAVVALFAACDQENEAAIYTPQGQGLAFTSNSMGSIEVEPNDANFSVDIVRGNSKGAYTGKVNKVTAEVDGKAVDYNSICTIGDFTFEDGKCSSSFNVNVDKLPVGSVLSLTMELTDSTNLAPTEGTSVISVSVNKKYVWESAGTCDFTDFTFASDDSGVTAKGVPVEHAQATNLYRIVKPWIACYGPAPDGFAEDSGIQFTFNGDDIDLVAPGSIVATADQYSFCWVANYVGSYCIKERSGNTWAFSMLGLIDGDGYHTGFAFQFTWNR